MCWASACALHRVVFSFILCWLLVISLWCQGVSNLLIAASLNRISLRIPDSLAKLVGLWFRAEAEHLHQLPCFLYLERLCVWSLSVEDFYYSRGWHDPLGRTLGPAESSISFHQCSVDWMDKALLLFLVKMDTVVPLMRVNICLSATETFSFLCCSSSVYLLLEQRWQDVHLSCTLSSQTLGLCKTVFIFKQRQSIILGRNANNFISVTFKAYL